MRRNLNVTTVCALALTLIIGWMAVAASGQAQPESSPAVKTPWGAPSLEGVWETLVSTPVERNPKIGQRELLTEQERAAMAKAAAERKTREDRVHPRGSEQDVQGGYNIAFSPGKPPGRFSSLVIDPPDGRIPPMTPEAERLAKVQREFEVMLLQATSACKTQRPECAGGKYGPVSPRYSEVPPYYAAQSYFAGGLNRAFGPEDMDLRTRCLQPPVPNYNGPLRIVQSKKSVSIVYEAGQGQNWVRVIPITDRPHAPSQVRFWAGDSRARWEGDTLVVDVTNFDPRIIFPDDGGYAGRVGGARQNLHLIEKIKRVDANTLQYFVTVEDPTTWTKPWTVRQEFTHQDDRKNEFYYEPRCHEGNHGLVSIMSGAREMDKAFKQGKGPDPATLCIAQCGGDRGE